VATPWVKDVHAQTTKEIAMSGTTERILIVIFLIVAVLLAMRDAHAGMIGKLNPYAGSRSHTTVDPTIRATAIARLNTRAGEVIGNAAQENLVHADFWLCRHAALDAALAT